MTYDEMVDRLAAEAMQPTPPYGRAASKRAAVGMAATVLLGQVMDVLFSLLDGETERSERRKSDKRREVAKNRYRSTAATPSEPLVPVPQLERDRPAPSGLTFEHTSVDEAEARARAAEAL